MPPTLPQAFRNLRRTRGSFDGQWFTEEDEGATRLALKVNRHLYHETSPYQRIDVYESDFFGRFLTLDDLLMFTERDEFVYHEMLVHVPLCSLPNPRQVLIIGGGDCGCLREVLRHPQIERVTLCEMDERVCAVCREWFPWVKPALQDPRVLTVHADGVQHVQQYAEIYDLVVVDSTDPVGPALPLFLADFYDTVRRSLLPGGVMTAQAESPVWNPELVSAILAQQRQSFPAVSLYLGQVPTYQGGTWCWSYATLDPAAAPRPLPSRAAALTGESRYYTPEVHAAAFVLPPFVCQVADGRNPFRPVVSRHRDSSIKPV
ncbi:MAG: polyamine aminopropyltransferase [Acidobacteriota bacterium]